MQYEYFFSFGMFWLIILTYQDLKKGKIDSRYNWFMSGIIGCMIYTIKPSIVHVLILVAASVLFSMIVSKAVGKGDLTAFSWIIIGFGLIEYYLPVVFLVWLASLTCLHYSIRFFSKIKGKVAFYPVIISSFLLTILVLF